MEFKLFKNEHIDEQQGKHNAYIKKGLKLVEQTQRKDGIVYRKYN